LYANNVRALNFGMAIYQENKKSSHAEPMKSVQRVNTPIVASILAPAKRLEKIALAVTGKHRASCFTSAVGAATIIHALDALRLEPSTAEDRRWNYIFQGMTQALQHMDLRTLCNVLHCSARMILRAYAPDHQQSSSPPQDRRLGRQQQPDALEIPRDVAAALLHIQIEILTKITSEGTVFTAAQTLAVFQSLSKLRSLVLHNTASAVNDELWFLVKERSPVLAEQVENTRDLASLLLVVSSNVDEWSDATVVQDVLRNGKRILETTATHQDAMRLFDAITRRSVDRHGNVSVFPVPSPLRPILQDIFGVVVPKHIDELSPPQLAAWFSRVLDEYAARSDPSSKLLWNRDTAARGGRRHDDAAAKESYDSTVARMLLSRVRRAANLEALSDSALRTLSLSVSRLWTPPKTDSQESNDASALSYADHARRVERIFFMSLADGIIAQTSICEEIFSRVGPRHGNGTRKVSEIPQASTEKFVDAMIAVPQLLLAAPDVAAALSMNNNDRLLKHGQALFALICKAVDDHLARYARTQPQDGTLGILSSSRARTAFVAFGLHLALSHRPPTALSTPPSKDASVIQDTIWTCLAEEWCMSRRHLRNVPIIDLIGLVNELCAYTYVTSYTFKKMHQRSHDQGDVGRHTVRSVERLREILMNIHDVVKRKASTIASSPHLEAPSTGSPQAAELEAVSTGQLLRYISSMSKLGVRKKGEFMMFAHHLSTRGSLTNFEVLRLLTVASRQRLHLPFLLDFMALNLAALQRTLLPKQKIMLVKALGQLGSRWDDLVARRNHLLSSSSTSNGSDKLQAGSHHDPEEDRRSHRRKRNMTARFDWSLQWFLDSDASATAFDVAVMSPIDAVSLIVGWVRVQLGTSAECLNLLTSVSHDHSGRATMGIAPSGKSGTEPQLLTRALTLLGSAVLGKGVEQNIAQITSLNVVVDLVVSLALLIESRNASGTRNDSDSVESDEALRLLLLSSASRRAIALISRASSDTLSFQDLNLLSLHWTALSRCAVRDDSVADAVRRLFAAARGAIASKLKLVARSSQLRPNTFVVSQLRAAVVFGCFRDDVLCLDDSSQDTAWSTLTATDWATLVENIALDHLAFNATKEPKEIADTLAIVDLAVVVRHDQQHRCGGSMTTGAGSSKLSAFASEVAPKIWDALSNDEKFVVTALVPACRSVVAPPVGAIST
jgi:hypothetical protein